jgi:hypothetical protein
MIVEIIMEITFEDVIETLKDYPDEDKMEVSEGNPHGVYEIGGYSLNWSLDLSSNTITLNIPNRLDLGTKIINVNNPVAHYSGKKFYAEISADFELKKLLLNGYQRISLPHHGPRTIKYENIIITTW